MHNTTLILAAGWEQIIVVVVFFLISILGQLFTNKQKPKKPKRVGPPQPRPGMAPGPQRPQGNKTPQEKLRSEVEDFLKQMRGEAPAEPPELRPVTLKVEQAPPRKTPAPRPAAMTPRTLRQESVPEHVARHISTAELASHAGKLGDDLELTDERMEAHLKQTFEHQVGHLARTPEKSEARKQTTSAQELAKMLSNPRGMRQAILAAEILRRPQL